MNQLRPARERALEELLTRLQPRLRAILAGHRIPYQDAEDLIQQSLLAYLYKQDSVGDAEKWLIGTVRNRCRAYWRERRRSFTTSMDAALLEEVAEPGTTGQQRIEFRHDLEAALEQISGRCQELLRLRYAQGCALPEAARRMGYRPSGIHKTLGRCLAALASRLVANGLVGRQRRRDGERA